MKAFLVTLVVIATHLALTLSAQAEGMPHSASQPKAGSSKAPQFITKGIPLTQQELAALNQRPSAGGRISRDAAGSMSKEGVVIGVVVGAAALGALIYITVVQAQDASKLLK